MHRPVRQCNNLFICMYWWVGESAFGGSHGGMKQADVITRLNFSSEKESLCDNLVIFYIIVL